MTSPTIRSATPDDGAALLALTRACPMHADIALLIEREPDFFALARARGASRTLVATVGDAVIGCASIARRPAWIGGEPSEMGIIADLKVHPEHRGDGLGQRLVDALAELHADAPPAVYVGALAEGNVAIDTVVERFGASRSLSTLGRFVALQLLPLWPMRVGFTTETVTFEHVAGFLDANLRSKAFAPIFGATSFPGIYRVVRDGSDIVAAVGEWDAHAIKRTRVIGMPPALRVLSTVTGLASRVLPTVALPRVGEVLQHRYLRHAACLPGHEAALEALIRASINGARTRGEPFVLFTEAEDDPLLKRLSKLPHTTYRYRLVAGLNRPQAQAQLDAIVGGPMVDDAALA